MLCNVSYLFSLEHSKIRPLQPKKWMSERMDTIIQFCQTAISSRFLRDDYKESIELVLVVLGYTPPNFTFKKPGAFHKARWMAPLIYGLKIFLFRNALKKSKKEQLQLER